MFGLLQQQCSTRDRFKDARAGYTPREWNG